MRYLFVDVENIGLKNLKLIKVNSIDKVKVFSNCLMVIDYCKEREFECVTGYEVGHNQADFHIIGSMSVAASRLTDKQKNSCCFHLYTNDNALATAFAFQCKLHNVHYKVLGVAPINRLSNEDIIFNALKIPKRFNDLKDSLKLPVSDLTRAMNALISENRIRRSSESKRKWIQVNTRNHVR